MPIITGGQVISGGLINGDGTGAPFTWNGVPVSGASGTYVGKAVAGSRLVNLATGVRYTAAGTTTGSLVNWVADA